MTTVPVHPVPFLGPRELSRDTDGREVDPSLGLLQGEGAAQRVRTPEPHPGHLAPTRLDAAARTPTYYGLPVLQEPVWIWTVPAYLFVGGLAGAASALGAASLIAGGPALERLEIRCRVLGLVGDVLGSGLLIADLGRPGRFFNMLRVFRPTSPMSVGSWILALSGAANGAGVLLGRRRGVLGAAGRVGTAAGGGLGALLAGYTGVLLANTAVPLWQAARRELPVLFVGSGMASAGAVLELFPDSGASRKLTHWYGSIGKVVALGAMVAMERSAPRAPRVTEPLRSGATGALWRAGLALTAAGLFASGLGNGTRRRERIAAALTLAGALATRLAVVHAGKRSARDPRATFEGQRAGMGAAELSRAPVPKPAAFKLPVVR
jgi:formate-dependent nitrite reductase membrane component NrfD